MSQAGTKDVKHRYRRERVGMVVSDRMQKTRVVEVTRLLAHPLYKKVIRLKNRYKAHDENNESKTGDKVLMIETRPLSKDKRWRISKVLAH